MIKGKKASVNVVFNELTEVKKNNQGYFFICCFLQKLQHRIQKLL